MVPCFLSGIRICRILGWQDLFGVCYVALFPLGHQDLQDFGISRIFWAIVMVILSGVGLAEFWDWQDFLGDCYVDIIWSRIGRILGLAGFFGRLLW